jgi:hypothetical protein
VNRSFHILVDDRGLSRALLENWVPALDPDVIWFIGDSEPDPDLLHDIIPVVPMSAREPGSALVELRATSQEIRIVAIFESIEHLVCAAQFGLTAQRAVLVNIRAQGERLSAQVMINTEQASQLNSLQQRGFDFHLQPLPNVTSRGLRAATPTVTRDS